MTSIESLPTEILVGIFSYLEKYELLVVENTCVRWKALVQEHIWDRLTCIDCDTVGYPDEGCFDNFIAIVDRVKQVKEFFYVLEEMREKTRSEPRLKDRLKKAQSELLRKRTADAEFPLHNIGDLVKSGLKKPCGKLARSEARSHVHETMKELQFSTFEVLEIDDLSLHDPRDDYNRFVVSCRGHKVDIPLKSNRVTRLEIGCLVLSLAPSCWPAVMASQNVLSHLMNLKQLETVNIRSILMSLPSKKENEDCDDDGEDDYDDESDEDDDNDGMTISISFNPHSCVLAVGDFLSLVKAIARNDDTERIQKMLEWIKRWQNNRNCVQVGALTVYNIEIGRIEDLLRAGGNLNNIPASKRDCVFPVLNELLWSVVDNLDLFVWQPNAIEDDILVRLQQSGLFSRLKKFGINISSRDNYETIEMTPAERESQMNRTSDLLRRLDGKLQNLEEVYLGLFVSNQACPSSAFNPVVLVSDPLPSLKNIHVNGTPPFPFVLSLIQHAPNLVDVNVSSREFEEKRVGLEWMLKLLRAIGDRRRLKYVYVTVTRRIQEFEISPQRGVKCNNEKARDSNQDLLDDISRQIEFLKTALSTLKMVTIDLRIYDRRAYWDYMKL